MNNHRFYRAHSDKRTLNQLDSFIQSALDKYQFSEYPKEKFLEIGPECSKLLTSYKSYVPDLVVFNKKFNKNECFYNANTNYNNPYPRTKYILKAKNNLISTIKKTNDNTENNNEEWQENDGDEGDPQWYDCNIEEVKESKMNFQALPGMEEPTVKVTEMKKKEIEADDMMDHLASLLNHTDSVIPHTIIKNHEVSTDGNVENLNNSRNKSNKALIDINHTENKNSNVNDYLNLFRQHYEQEPIESNNKDNDNLDEDFPFHKFAKKDEESGSENENADKVKINKEYEDKLLADEFNELMNKFKDISAKMDNKVEENKDDELNSSIEHNLANLKNLVDDKDFDDNGEFHNDSREDLHNDVKVDYNRIESNLNELCDSQDLDRPGDLSVYDKVTGTEDTEKGSTDTMSAYHRVQEYESQQMKKIEQNMNNTGNNAGLHGRTQSPNFMSAIYTTFLENPIYVVTKNLLHRGWVITLADTEKVINCFNSFELLAFYDNEIKNGRKIDTLYATDYDTDMCFTPHLLYDIIKENNEKLKALKKDQMLLMQQQMMVNNMGMNHGGMKKFGNIMSNMQSMKGMGGMNNFNNVNNPSSIPNFSINQNNIPGNTTNKKAKNLGVQSQNSNEFPRSTSNPNFNFQGNYTNTQMNNFYMMNNGGSINMNSFNVNNQRSFNGSMNMNNMNMNSTKAYSTASNEKMMNNNQNFKLPFPNFGYPNTFNQQQMRPGAGFGNMMQQFPYMMNNSNYSNQRPNLNLNVNVNIVNNDIKMNNIMINSNSNNLSKSNSDLNNSNLSLEKRISTEDQVSQNKVVVNAVQEQEQKKEVSKVKDFFDSMSGINKPIPTVIKSKQSSNQNITTNTQNKPPEVKKMANKKVIKK